MKTINILISNAYEFVISGFCFKKLFVYFYFVKVYRNRSLCYDNIKLLFIM